MPAHSVYHCMDTRSECGAICALQASPQIRIRFGLCDARSLSVSLRRVVIGMWSNLCITPLKYRYLSYVPIYIYIYKFKALTCECILQNVTLKFSLYWVQTIEIFVSINMVLHYTAGLDPHRFASMHVHRSISQVQLLI